MHDTSIIAIAHFGIIPNIVILNLYFIIFPVINTFQLQTYTASASSSFRKPILKFQNHFLLTSAALGSQLLKNYDLGIDDKGKPVVLTFEKIKSFFFDILLGKIEVQEISGNFDISDITGKFK